MPVSDDEWEAQFSLPGMFGRHRQRKEWVLRALLPHYNFATLVRRPSGVSPVDPAANRPVAAAHSASCHELAASMARHAHLGTPLARHCTRGEGDAGQLDEVEAYTTCSAHS